MTDTDLLEIVDALVEVESFAVKAIPIFQSGGLIGKIQVLGLLTHVTPYLEALSNITVGELKTELNGMLTDETQRQSVLQEIAKISSQEGVPYADVVASVLSRADQAIAFAEQVIADIKGWFGTPAAKLNAKCQAFHPMARYYRRQAK